jgi:hypothetical protein
MSYRNGSQFAGRSGAEVGGGVAPTGVVVVESLDGGAVAVVLVLAGRVVVLVASGRVVDDVGEEGADVVGVGVVVVDGAGGGNRSSNVTGGHTGAALAGEGGAPSAIRPPMRISAAMSAAPSLLNMSRRLPKRPGVGNPAMMQYVGRA